MIALQARNPQLPDPAQRTARLANMMNMARQTEAAQLQGERLRQEMEYAQAGETRAAATHTSAQKKAELEYVGLAAEQFRQDVAKIREGDVAGYEAARADIVSKIPSWANYIRPASEWTPDYAAQLMSKASEIVAQTYPAAKAVIEYAAEGGVDAQGRPVPEGTPIQVVTGRRPSTTPIPAAGGAATPAPTAPAAGPVPTGKFGETRVVPPESIPLTPYQQEHIREMQSGLGMSQPASFTRGAGAGQMTPQMAQQIVDTAVKTGMMAQADFDQLMALAPEQNKQPFMDMLKANNIALQPGGAGQQSQFADLRGQRMQSQTAGLRGAPPMEQTLAQYQPVQRRDPNVSPLPGSAQVPLSRVAGEAEARRETPAQIQARKTAELQAAEAFEEANKGTRLARKREEVFEGERAKKDAAFVDSYSDATTKGRTTLNVIDQMIGDARIEKGKLVVPKGGRRPHPGFEGVVGMGVPGVRFIPGTQAASFDALFRQAEGGAFLQAYESLRGTGQITEIEGTKATSALTRMERSQSEAEFVKAAREFADVIRGAVDRADKRYTTLTGKAPPVAAPRRKTPTKGSDGWGKAKVVGN
jgi:hypothetical protein